ncbi:hypothetical protein [Methylophilus sp. DW102]|uniref:hypothetical protein n=1 Tax=Methylophilus sp. DW102 TaxID=3095607 RepID=UPI00308E58F4|nr:hypothetical protein MTDW_26430 [Methylophilus sp. DW102]
MHLNLPTAIEAYTHKEQFNWIESWAHLPIDDLHSKATELWHAHQTQFSGMTSLLQQIITKTWFWPEYETYIANGGDQSKADLLDDMIDKVRRKIIARRNHIYRVHQANKLLELRPYVEVKHCNGKTIQIAFDSSAAIKEFEKIIECRAIDCACIFYTQTRAEYERANFKANP